eukprot:9874727-Lingulodinium_polyedra.AAC.1
MPAVVCTRWAIRRAKRCRAVRRQGQVAQGAAEPWRLSPAIGGQGWHVGGSWKPVGKTLFTRPA